MREGLNGSLAQWPLGDVLSMLSASRQTGRIELTDGPRRADIYIADGAIVHAVAADQAGHYALVAVMVWGTGVFSFEPRVSAPDTTITLPTAELLELCQREADDRAAIMKVIPSPSSAPHLVRTRPRDDIMLSPEEWQLVAHVDGRTSAAELARTLNIEDYAFARLVNRLCTDGLVAFESPPAAIRLAQRSVPAVDQAFFIHLTRATAMALGPLAPVVIDDAVAALNETRESFPAEKLSRLVELVANDIREDARRVPFQQTMIQWMRARAA